MAVDKLKKVRNTPSLRVFALGLFLILSIPAATPNLVPNGDFLTHLNYTDDGNWTRLTDVFVNGFSDNETFALGGTYSFLYEDWSNVNPPHLQEWAYSSLINISNNTGSNRFYTLNFSSRYFSACTRPSIRIEGFSSVLTDNYTINNSEADAPISDAWYNDTVSYSFMVNSSTAYLRLYLRSFWNVSNDPYNCPISSSAVKWASWGNITLATANFSGSAFYPLSFPDLQPYNITFVDPNSGEILNWVPLNQPFELRYTLQTPAGLMNPTTEVICPVKTTSERSAIGIANVKADALGCVVQRQSFRSIPREQGFFCINTDNLCLINCDIYNSDSLCLSTWSSIENTSIKSIASIAFTWNWFNDFKIYSDQYQKTFYATSNITCSNPVNMSVLIDYIDKNSCAPDYIFNPTNPTYHSYIFNFTIGIEPISGEACDISLNSTCNINSSTGRLAEISNPSDITGGGVNPFGSDVAIEDQYNTILSYLEQPWVLMFLGTIILGVAGAYYGGALIGGIAVLMMIILMSILGLIPLWLLFLIATLVALGMAFMGKKILS